MDLRVSLIALAFSDVANTGFARFADGCSVFFILDLKHFLRRSETIENLKERVCWLPTWEQMRQLLREHDVSDQTVVEHLELTQAIGRGTERLELYRLFEERLTGGLM